MSQTAVITKREFVNVDNVVDTVREALATHVSGDFGHTHIGANVTQPATPYSDSAGHAWGDRVLAVRVNGVVYYVPAVNVP